MRRKTLLFILFSVGIFSVTVHILTRSNLGQSALLYVGIPFLLAVLIAAFTEQTKYTGWKSAFWNSLRYSLIIMLASSVILFEGFLCVAMFLPIYLIVFGLTFTVVYWTEKRKKEKGAKLTLSIFAVMIVLSSFEGTHESLSFDRYQEVSVTQIVSISQADILSNLEKPIDLKKDRPWFLEMFPMPYSINAGSLQEGDIHRIDYRYHRWFVTNTHEGYMLLKIVKVRNNEIKTQFIKDTSYISKYLTLHGTHIKLEPINSKKTRITLTIKYDRDLDPAWYFGPLERYGVKKAAEFLITEIMARKKSV